MNTLKVMADYECFPLWSYDGDELIGNLDPRSLPISPELRADLASWASEFDSGLDPVSPHLSRWEPSAHQRFVETGRELARRLKSELRGSFRILFKARTGLEEI